jgi:predicted RNA methylase
MSYYTDNIEYVIEALKKIRYTGEDFDWHWGFVDWKNKSVLDLGADIGSTAECFLDVGSNKIIAVEGNKDLYDRLYQYSETDQRIVPIHKYIANKEDLKYLLSSYGEFTDVAKIDIEGAEKFLLELQDDVIKNIKEYAIECHSKDLLANISNMFNSKGYKITTTKFLTKDISVIHAIWLEKER